MIAYGPCHCGDKLVRRLDEDDTKFACVNCGQMLVPLEDKND